MKWRCFVHYGKILDIRKYRGDWKVYFDPKVVEEAISKFTSAPNGYTIDFGLTDKGKLKLMMSMY